GREARNLFLDPTAKVTMDLYQQLIDRGFRRLSLYTSIIRSQTQDEMNNLLKPLHLNLTMIKERNTCIKAVLIRLFEYRKYLQALM
ncbi:MAG: hypothetical protein KZQ98_21580, partial [Candidatus Thiodiazotropha sp. (ex Lucinoma borealis)]|nr:hypothetical protein [Candidatus Thiodiazotropha sp. (ex Lucinoma borealis)]